MVATLPFFAHEARHDPKRIQIVRLIKLQRVLLRNPFARDDLLGDGSQGVGNKRKFHQGKRVPCGETRTSYDAQGDAFVQVL